MPSTLFAKRLRLAALAASPPQRPARTPDLAITNLSAWAVKEPSGGRQYVVVKVETDGGLVGYGETSAAPDAATAVARAVSVREVLAGQDALASQAVDSLLVRANAPAGARAAVNTALLDILGKASKAPLYEALSGRTRDKARALAPLHGGDLASLRRSLERARAKGFRAFAVEVQIPSGPMRGREFYRAAFDLLGSLREAGAADLVLDCGGRTTPAEAASLAAGLETFHPLWIDEPTGKVNNEVLLKISGETVTPIGWGRNIAGNDGFQDLLRLQAIDVLRPSLSQHGIASIRKAAALAETYYTAFAPYHAGGPIATAAALHIAASTPNFFIQQIPLPAADRDLAMREELAGAGLEAPSGGFLELPSGHGLGIEVNEDALAKYAA